MSYPVPNPHLDIQLQEITTLFAMLIWGEARGESDAGKEAVANVVRNRVLSGRFGGDAWRYVILKPWQFSCFNADDPNRVKLLTPTEHGTPDTWDRCYDVANDILNGKLKDNTARATHYFVIGSSTPKWARAFVHTVDLGKHAFYRDTNAYAIDREPAEKTSEPLPVPKQDES